MASKLFLRMTNLFNWEQALSLSLAEAFNITFQRRQCLKQMNKKTRIACRYSTANWKRKKKCKLAFSQFWSFAFSMLIMTKISLCQARSLCTRTNQNIWLVEQEIVIIFYRGKAFQDAIAPSITQENKDGPWQRRATRRRRLEHLFSLKMLINYNQEAFQSAWQSRIKWNWASSRMTCYSILSRSQTYKFKIRELN